MFKKENPLLLLLVLVNDGRWTLVSRPKFSWSSNLIDTQELISSSSTLGNYYVISNYAIQIYVLVRTNVNGSYLL